MNADERALVEDFINKVETYRLRSELIHAGSPISITQDMMHARDVLRSALASPKASPLQAETGGDFFERIIKMARCQHEKRGGGNDYMLCDDCGLMWDCRRESAHDGLVNFIKLQPLDASRPSPAEKEKTNAETYVEVVADSPAGDSCSPVVRQRRNAHGTSTTGVTFDPHNNAVPFDQAGYVWPSHADRQEKK